MKSEFYTLEKWVNESDNVVFITGPDLSAAAGFPDYRGMDGDFLQKYRFPTETLLTRSFLKRNAFLFFKYYRERVLAPLLEAKPTYTHELLAKLEASGKLKALLTVNVDGLHQEADSKNVLELHGSVMRNWCDKCEKYLDFFYIADSPTPVPYCNVDMCGDIVRPDIVLGEEPYDLELIARAGDYCRQADVLIIDGSALKQFPVPNLMKCYQGHKLILFNTAPLVFDARAGLVLHDPIDATFSAINITL